MVRAFECGKMGGFWVDSNFFVITGRYELECYGGGFN